MPPRKRHRNGLAKLVPNEKHITDTNSGHEIHKEQPQLVISAIPTLLKPSAAEDGSLRGESIRVGIRFAFG
jgi:hypothetical protein